MFGFFCTVLLICEVQVLLVKMILTEDLDVVFDIVDADIKTIVLVFDPRNGLWSNDFCRRVYMMNF